MVKESTQYKRRHKQDYGRERIEVLYEDRQIIVINKPSGMLSVPYPGSKNRTVLDAVEHFMRSCGTYSAYRKPFAVHRLDRDTSGVMMIALSHAAQSRIMRAWHTMVTERLYRAVAENPTENPLPDFGVIDAPLAYNAYNAGFVPKADDVPSRNIIPHRRMNGEKSTYERNLAYKNGQVFFKTVAARTHYKVIVRGNTHTLFELSLDTGKKNQIRAHLAYKGYTLAGDENYRARTDPFGRLALHARTLEFNHPFTGEHMKFEVKEPCEWHSYVERGDSHPCTPIWRHDVT